MNTELKKAIVNFILDNEKEFQLHNTTKSKFRPYIYDAEGQFLIGGKEVSLFIDAFVQLFKNS